MPRATPGLFGIRFAPGRLDPKRSRSGSTPTLAQRFFQLPHPLLQSLDRRLLLEDDRRLLEHDLHDRRRLLREELFDLLRAERHGLHPA